MAKNSFITRIYQFLNLDYRKISLNENRPVPKWMKVKVNNDFLCISGCCNLSKGKFLLRIKNINGFIIMDKKIELVKTNTKLEDE